MLYAKVVVGRPVAGPFDYSVPESLRDRIAVGLRVKVSFGFTSMTGYVVGLVRQSSIAKVKEISGILEDAPALDRHMLALTKEVSLYYCCSWGEAIETALPQGLRKGRRLPPISAPQPVLGAQNEQSLVLLHDLGNRAKRWEIYAQYIEQTIRAKKSVLVLVPDIDAILPAKEMFIRLTDIPIIALYRKEKDEIAQWSKCKEGKAGIVIGTRSAIFAPLSNLGLIIIDNEEDSAYKQDQAPHYHAREVAFMRARRQKITLLLGSSAPSLESYYLAQQGKLEYKVIPRQGMVPVAKIVDMRTEYRFAGKKPVLLPRYVQDAVAECVARAGKALLILNRTGFATSATCHNCGHSMRCPRCNVNLVYHFSGKKLSCHYCNFAMESPDICPSCQAGYIKFFGAGTEKIESELSRVFPQAHIKRIDATVCGIDSAADIYIATSAIFGRTNLLFDTVVVLAVDSALNRVDFRSAEKVYSLLAPAFALAERSFIVQTSYPTHHCFQAFPGNDPRIYYTRELLERTQLGFPPVKHIIAVKLRGKVSEKVEAAARACFNAFSSACPKGIELLSVGPSQRQKLRGSFYWEIILRAKSLSPVCSFIKDNLKKVARSGIIVTIDVDPV